MNRRSLVIGTALLSIAAFGGGILLYRANEQAAAPVDTPLVRPHSPILGPVNAPVTIVEFFDPACETCRAFHPVVKQIMGAFPGKVRVVLRYAAFHPTSADAIAVLETARMQGLFEPVLAALFEAQPFWSPHGRPPATTPWNIAARAGLDIDRARRDAQSQAIAANLDQDAADVKTVGVRQTPTFFVNGRPLTQFGAQQLFNLVKSEVEAR